MMGHVVQRKSSNIYSNRIDVGLVINKQRKAFHFYSVIICYHIKAAIPLQSLFFMSMK